MFGILLAIGAAITAGITDPMIKKTIKVNGRYKALVYNFVFLCLFLFLGAILLNIKLVFPSELLPAFIAETVIGAMGIIVYFKALESGRVSVLGPLSAVYVLIVVILGIIIFGEHLSALQILGGILVILAGITLGIEDLSKFKLEKGALYILIVIFSWGYYYGFLKLFVSTIGPYMTTLTLETSLMFVIIVYYLFKKKDISLPSIEGMKSIGLRSFIVFVSALLYSYSVGEIGAALTSIITAASPLISVPASFLILKEKLTVYKYAAVVLIVIGLLMVLAK